MTKYIVSFAYTDDNGELELDNLTFFDTYEEARSYMNKMISDNIEYYMDARLEMDRWSYTITSDTTRAKEIMTIEGFEV